MGFQNGKFFFDILKLGILVPVYFGNGLGVSLAATQRGIKPDGYQNGKFFLVLQTCHFGNPFGCLQKHPPKGTKILPT